MVTPAILDKVWPSLQSRYAFLVVDAGSQFTDTVLTVLERSDDILLVLSPEMASVKSASDALQVFDQLGFPPHCISPTINSVSPKGYLRTANVESVLGRGVTTVIPHESATFVQAINQGQPFVVANSKTKAGMVISSLAYQLSAATMEVAKSGPESPLLGRVRKMVKNAGP
jgi:pilus assembly protein CpaE